MRLNHFGRKCALTCCIAAVLLVNGMSQVQAQDGPFLRILDPPLPPAVPDSDRLLILAPDTSPPFSSMFQQEDEYEPPSEDYTADEYTSDDFTPVMREWSLLDCASLKFDQMLEGAHGKLVCLSEMLEPIPQTMDCIALGMRDYFECYLQTEYEETGSRLSDEAIGLQRIPDRPPLLLELNELFLGAGDLSPGIETCTCAVWRPALWVFGTYRAGYNYFDRRGPGSTVSEVVHRLDLFTQLNLTGTERLLVGLRPLDEEEFQTPPLLARREYNSYDFSQGSGLDGWNADIETLFFEGDFGEIFPNLDPRDMLGLDYGFSVGRQPVLFQDGLLINENRMDAVTITRNTLYGGGNLNLRVTGMYSWDQISRQGGTMPGQFGNRVDNDARLFGIFTESDFRVSTVNVDAVYVSSHLQEDRNGNLYDASAFYLAASAIQRVAGNCNTYNTSFHVLGSFPTGEETFAAGQGELLFAQISWTPHHTEDLVYVNGFWAIDQFTSAARGPEMGGPLGQVGILYAAPAIGRFGAPISNQATNAVGGSVGYEMLFDDSRKQLILELAGRTDTDGADNAEVALGASYQQACGQRGIVTFVPFFGAREGAGTIGGARAEFLVQF